MSFVLDASMALAWQFPRADAAEAALAIKILTELPASGASVPAIWHSEVANALLRGERAGKIPTLQVSYFLEQLAKSAIAPDAEPQWLSLPRAVALARVHGLTAYDASYLELAQRLALPLATFDRKLAEAARAAGVRVFGDIT